MTDTAIVLGQAAVSNGRFEVVGQYSTGETYGALYPKGSANAATLDKVIQALIDDGTLEEAGGQVSGRGLGRRSDRDPLLPAVSDEERRRSRPAGRCATGGAPPSPRAPGRGTRRFRAAAPPREATSWAATALLVALLLVAVSWMTLRGVHGALAELRSAASITDICWSMPSASPPASS